MWLPSGSDRFNKPTFLSVNGDAPVLMQARHWRLIYIITQALSDDRKKRIPAPAAGWRSRQEIADAIRVLSGYPVSLGAVSSYGSQVSRFLRRALTRLSKAGFFEMRPRQGYRLAAGIKVTIVARVERN